MGAISQGDVNGRTDITRKVLIKRHVMSLGGNEYLETAGMIFVPKRIKAGSKSVPFPMACAQFLKALSWFGLTALD